MLNTPLAAELRVSVHSVQGFAVPLFPTVHLPFLFLQIRQLLQGQTKFRYLWQWGTEWREETTYHYTCVEPSCFNLGAMSPRSVIAITIPVVYGFTVGAGIATVSQFQMKTTAQVYREVS